jgi:hypothetical protein
LVIYFKEAAQTGTDWHRLRVCERGAARGISQCKREEVTGESGKLHNEELHHLYFSPNIK